MSGSSSPKKNNSSDKKFFFDRHNFDAPEEPAADEPPPPPIFTEEELTEEKAKSFEDGKHAGLEEAHASREQQITQTLNVIAEQFSALFAAEQLRENLYERESLKLAQKMLEIILPEFNRRFGNEEIFPVIENTLRNFNQKTAITITLPDDLKEDIEARLYQKWPEEEMRPRFRLIGRTDMPQGSCEMAWEDGGAIRNAGELIEKIRLELERFVPPAPPDENKPPEEPETGDSPDPENNVITKGKDSRDTPAQPDLETGDNHE